jgi:hypothetical protein
MATESGRPVAASAAMTRAMTRLLPREDHAMCVSAVVAQPRFTRLIDQLNQLAQRLFGRLQRWLGHSKLRLRMDGAQA